MGLSRYSKNEVPTSTKFNLMVDQVNANTDAISGKVDKYITVKSGTLESSGLGTLNAPTAGIGSTNTLVLPSEITSYQIPFNVSKPIAVKSGQTIIVDCSHAGGVTLCKTNKANIVSGDTCICVASQPSGSISWTATEDCYVLHITYGVFIAETYVIKGELAEAVTDISNKLSGIDNALADILGND